MKLVRIENIEEHYECWDLEIENTHCFFANGVLVHNSNGSVAMNSEEFWVQSRERIITVQDDSYGFTLFIEQRKDWLQDMIKNLGWDLTKNTISVFFEWVGKGIQRGVAISEIEKSAFILGVKVTPHDENEIPFWGNCIPQINKELRIFSIINFQKFNIEIDFNNPEPALKQIEGYVDAIEKECPVGKEFGVSGVGEGIVWKSVNSQKTYMFKTKGEKHKIASKKGKNIEVDPIKVQSIKEFVDYAVSENRLDQMLTKVFPDGIIDVKLTGEFLKAVVNDIYKEEMDVFVKSELETKDVNGEINKVAREWLFKK
jgi:hypothetical protein